MGTVHHLREVPPSQYVPIRLPPSFRWVYFARADIGLLKLPQGYSPNDYKDDVVYFIRCPATESVKIGWSTALYQRFRNLQLGSPVPLELLGFVPGNQAIEMHMHRRADALRMHGEWFKYTPKMALSIKKLGQLLRPKSHYEALLDHARGKPSTGTPNRHSQEH
jgi:hypothetical protein